MASTTNNTLHHLVSVKNREWVFENAFQAVSRMILESEIEKISELGKTTYRFKVFGTGKKHIIGMYNKINSLVSFYIYRKVDLSDALRKTRINDHMIRNITA